MIENACPICLCYVGWQGHALHRYGKYRVNYVMSDRNKVPMTEIQGRYYGDDDSDGWDTLITLDGFVVLDETRIEKLLLLK